MVTETKIF